MITIVGLGNIGAEYAHTRHNIGWMVLSDIVTRNDLKAPILKNAFSASITEGVLYTKTVGILFPATFMNNSGVSVQKYLKENSTLQELIVIHDEVDLLFGELRISYDRGAGGHNGVKSIIDACGGTGFTRIRIGIAEKSFFGGIKRPKGDRLADFVLKNFRAKELEELHNIGKRVEHALELILTKGREFAMQEINAEKRG